MRCGWTRATGAAAATAAVWLVSLVSVAGQAGTEPPMSEAFFKNVQVLKGIPVDEFMDTMGMFAASLGYDCVSCHSPNIYEQRATAYAETTPLVQRARQMIVMVNTINKNYFAGQARVSCFTCHHAKNRPDFIPSLALQYGELMDDPNAMAIFPDTRTTVDQVFAKYVQALGGAGRLAALTGWVARGSYEGFNTGGNQFPIEIVARAPGQRTQVVRTSEGDAVKTFDGTSAWAAEGWRPMPLLALTRGNLEAARLEATVAFPAGLRQAFSQWAISSTTIDNRIVQLLQGSNPNQLPVNFYFDESGLLVRIVRWNRTPVGTIPMQFEYADYRDVAGVKMPFRIVNTWTDGQNTIVLSDIQPNAAIPAARFARPAPYQKR
ncbi:MAG: photosynthetic reaction center cytochrome c subunit [Acidobacteria bacterium]|nr:photosynthetic reaction center cytochrome c subunit [Acidobacteriota bacterium]